MFKKVLLAALLVSGCHPVYAERQIEVSDRVYVDAEKICEMAGQKGNTSCTEILHDDYLRSIYKGMQLVRKGTTVTSTVAVTETLKDRPCNLDTEVCLESTKHFSKWMVYGGVESHNDDMYYELEDYFMFDQYYP